MRAIAMVLVLSVSVSAHAQSARSPDPQFPSPGRPGLLVATGAPYVAVAEVSLGVARNFAVGVITGIAPRDRAIGVRPRAAIDLVDGLRLIIELPFFAYPRRQDATSEPWLFLRARAVIEARFPTRAAVRVGASVMYADCTEMFFRRGVMNDSDFRGGVFHSIEVGATIPIARRAEFFVEAGTVHQRFRLVERGAWFGELPFLLVLGVAVAFDETGP